MEVKMMNGKIKKAEVTTEHAASSYGIPVIVIDGEAYGTADILANKIEFVSATAEERELLKKAGFGY